MLTAISGKNSLRIVDKINFSQLETDLLFHIDLRKGIYGRVYYEMGKAYSVVFTPSPFDPNSTEQNEFIYAINSIEGTNYSLDVLLDAFENFNTLNGTNSVRTSLQVENLISQQFSEKIKKLTGASYDLDSSINHFLNKEYAKLNSLKKNDLASLVSFSKDLLKKASIYLELPGFVQKYLEFSDKEIGSLVENFKYYLCFDKISEEGFRNALQKSIFELRDNSIRHDGQFYINPTPNVPDSIYQKILKNSYKSGNISIAGSGILMTAGLSSFLGFYGGLLLSILTLYITEVARYLVSDNVASYSSERYNVKNIGRGIFQSILFDRKYNKLFESCARDANLSVKLLAQKVNKKPLHQQTANFLDTILVETNEIRDYSGISFTKSFSDRKSPYSWIKKYSEALDEVRSNQ